MENNKDELVNVENSNNSQKDKIYETDKRINEIDDKLKYFESVKDNYNKLFLHENIENIHLIQNNQTINEKKIEYLQLNKEFHNIKKPELDFKLQLKKQIKNLFIEELATNNNNKNDNNNCYFHIEPDAFKYGNNNKNILYKSEGLTNIFN